MGRLPSRFLKERGPLFLSGAFSTCLGLGFFPKGSGTVASFFSIGFWILIGFYGLVATWICLGIITLASGFIVPLYEKLMKTEDSSTVVVDEWIGMGIAMATAGTNPWLIFIAFVLFRIFDITKPLGVRYFDQNYLKGWGVILDDVVAGFYALILVEVAKRWVF